MRFLRQPFRYSDYNLVFFVIGLNVLIFLLQWVFPRVTNYVALFPEEVLNGWVWQLATHMFAHGSPGHLLFNMLALFIFGTQVERRIGSKEFILYYMLTGILAGVASFLIYWATGAYNVYLLGASGAIFAVQLAYAVLFPEAILWIWGILPIRAPVMVLLFTGAELFFAAKQGVAGGTYGTGLRNGVAHITHLAGFAFGWVYFLVRFGINPWNSLFRRN
jgi:membrane associated rhomboid family serine protease